ncbi:MAG TPA: hypothetical protein VHW26_05370, partial [Solirubrobacteraceae bacterium]|nr:hypothetical protein [Solirubrobacteraceae bacterium]
MSALTPSFARAASPQWPAPFGLDASAGDLAAACSAAGQCPTISTGPTILGNPAQGQTLTEQGTWTNSPTSFTYAWDDCDVAGANCSPIPGAGAQAYVVGAADVGHTIRVVVTALNATGASDPATSVQSTVVLPLPPQVTSRPAVSGTAVAGQTLTEDHGSWTSGPTSFAYQWQDCDGTGAACAPIPGATGQMYALAAADVGHAIVVDETASNAGGSSSPASSAPTGAVQAVPPPPASPPADQSPPTIGPTAATVGATLASSPGTWSGTAPISYSYQWQRCHPACSVIAGATASSYVLRAADLRARLFVRVTAANVAGTVAALSAQVGPIAPAPPTVDQIRTQLLAQIAPASRTPGLAALLRAGGYTLRFKALSAGVARVDWYVVPPGAEIAARAKTLLVATGRLTFAAAGTRTLRLALTT